nr:MAG TPA: hypothetical protein [Caudoviricetes sp.]
MITSFEHKFDIGDTVFLTFYSRGKYRVRKKLGYKIRNIRFNLCMSLPLYDQPEDKKEKSVYYWFEGKNPSVFMTEECACFSSLQEAEEWCNQQNEKLGK